MDLPIEYMLGAFFVLSMVAVAVEEIYQRRRRGR